MTTSTSTPEPSGTINTAGNTSALEPSSDPDQYVREALTPPNAVETNEPASKRLHTPSKKAANTS